jgi:hypothetical protein
LLRGAGGVALALPFLDAMRPRRAGAQTEGNRRVIFEFKPNGDEIERRFDALDEQAFVLGEFLQPLEAYRSDLLFINRINKNFHRLDELERPDNHQEGGSSLAPWPFGEGDFPVGGAERTVGYVLGPSADHALGQRVIEKDPSVAYRHLVYRVGDRDNNIWNLHSHAGPVGQKNPVIPETDPISAYARLFGFLDVEQAAPAVASQVELRKSVLDLVGSQIKQLENQLGYEDRQRLQLHAEALRDLERTLSGIDKPATCAPFEVPQDIDPYSDTDHVRVAEAFFKITSMAFVCDLTRVVNFNWSGNTSERVYRNLGLEDGHHTISHRSDDSSFSDIRRIHRHLWENTTTLYEELMAVPDGEGSLWDNTLIVHWNELGQGDAHSLDDNLVVLAGGASGHFKKASLLEYEERGSFSDVLTSCFHYMGFSDVETFGDPRLSNMPFGDENLLA